MCDVCVSVCVCICVCVHVFSIHSRVPVCLVRFAATHHPEPFWRHPPKCGWTIMTFALNDAFTTNHTTRRLFLQSPANPDLLYIIFFCHTQLTVTLLLALIFGSKVSVFAFEFIKIKHWLLLIATSPNSPENFHWEISDILTILLWHDLQRFPSTRSAIRFSLEIIYLP